MGMALERSIALLLFQQELKFLAHRLSPLKRTPEEDFSQF
jgi:hypothetical protein